VNELRVENKAPKEQSYSENSSAFRTRKVRRDQIGKLLHFSTSVMGSQTPTFTNNQKQKIQQNNKRATKFCLSSS